MILWVCLALLFLHEMDAVRGTEWKMMIYMNKLDYETGTKSFIAAHFIMFIAIFYMFEFYFNILYWFICIFFLFHQLLHLLFKTHQENRMESRFSRVIVYLMTAVSFSGIIYGLLFNNN